MNGPWNGWDPPEGTAGWSDFHWWKVPAGKCLTLIIVSEAPLGYSGHFARGRMAPCQGEGCQLCHDGVGVQLRYLFAAVEPVSRRVGIWDVGRSVALEIKDNALSRGALRGMTLNLSHHSHSRQSRTQIELMTTDSAAWVNGVEAPNIARALVETWRKAKQVIPPGFERAAGLGGKPESVRSQITKSLKGV